MRFMMFIYPSLPTDDHDWEPTPEAVAEMSKYNEALTQAGVLLALDGLHPDAEGARVRRADGKTTVTDGPFTEAKELVGGYWTIQVKDKAEAVQWASRCPLGDGDMLEVRRVYEMTDFPQELQDAAELSQLPPEQTADR